MKLLGLTEVGVLQAQNGAYICWNNDIQRFYKSFNVNEAQTIMGNKEFNAKRVEDLYKKNTGDKTEFVLVLKAYAHITGGKSCFVETLRPDVLYDYVN